MEILGSPLDRASESFKVNSEHFTQLKEELTRRCHEAAQGGGPALIERHKSRGKLTARERLECLLDEGSSFLELSPLAAFGMYEGSAPGAGLITGIGKVSGRECVLVINDATVKGGTYFPMTVKKHLRAQEVARENGLPCIYLVDSGGAFLPLQSEVFPDKEHFGRIFYNQAQMSAEGLAQVAVVMGSCTAGGAYVPAMSDENIIVKNQGTIFLGGPPLVKAATGEVVSAEDLGGGRVHSETSGVTDHLAENDEHALDIARSIISHLGHRERQPIQMKTPEPPLYAPEEIYGLLPKDPRTQYDVREVLARLLDGSEFHEFKKLYGPTLVCGFGHIEGFPVGVLANNGILFSESAQKAAHFVELCNHRRIPLLFLQNISGFMVGRAYENEGIAKHGAKMVMAVSNATVPKFTVVIGGSYGAGNYGMCGRAFSPRQLWMWPNARISVMGGEQAAGVLWTVKKDQLEAKGQTLSAQDEEKFKAPVLSKYEEESSCYYSTARLWDDGVIDPAKTRQVVAMGIAASLCRPWDEPRQGIFRM